MMEAIIPPSRTPTRHYVTPKSLLKIEMYPANVPHPPAPFPREGE